MSINGWPNSTACSFSTKILIIGGGNIGFNLAKNLETDQEGVRVKIIEKERNSSKNL